MTSQNVKLTDLIAPSFYGVHHDIAEGGHTHYWMSGGRGSTKSTFISIELVLGIMADPAANAVVLRKVKETLRESVMDQIEWAIRALGVEDYWDIPDAKLVLTYKPTGQEIRFRGADKPKRIKGLKFPVGYCKFIWYEELDEFTSMEEVRLISQSLMRGGAEATVFYSYNPPKSGQNWVNVEKQLTRSDRLVHHSTYETVPEDWLGPVFLIEARLLKETNLKAYEHEYGGEVTGTGGEVFENVQIRRISDEEIEEFPTVDRGLDYGFAIDPVAYNVMHYDRKHKRLYIYFEFYKVGCSNSQLNREIVAENKDNKQIIADSAEPKSNHELRQYGRKIRAVKKGPDSVEYGVKFLQQLSAIIIDDTRCPETAREFLAYELERDVHGNFKAGYPDKNNHAIDAVRYALNDEWLKHKGKKPKPESDDPTPAETHEKARRKLTGGKPNMAAYTKW